LSADKLPTAKESNKNDCRLTDEEKFRRQSKKKPILKEARGI
jgi:hypothetical protein